VSRSRRPAPARKDYAPERKITRARDVRVGAVDVGLHKGNAHVVRLGEACVPIAVRGLMRIGTQEDVDGTARR
jgi:hypothetical protein